MSDSSEQEIDNPERVKLWAAAMKLNEHTATELLRLGFDTMEAVSTIEREDLPTFKIPLGQKKVLMKAVKKTFQSDSEAEQSGKAEGSNMAATAHSDGQIEATHPAGLASDTTQNGGNLTSGINNQDGGAHGNIPKPDDAYVQEILKMMANHKQTMGQSTVSNVQNSTGSDNALVISDIQSWKDPQLFFKSTNIDPNVNFFDITDYVPNPFGGIIDSDDKLMVSQASSGQLVFKSGPAKPKLESLSVTQWSMANLSILQKLMFTGELSNDHVADYLSYTMRVYHLFSSCEMVSVLFYDREYRRLQKQHQFRWGTDVPHLHSVFLRPKFFQNHLPRPNSQVHSAKQALQNRPHTVSYASHTPSGKPICKKFNSRKGCVMQHCKFEHVCALPGCAEKHPAFQHTKN